MTKIRLHKLVSDFVLRSSLEYSKSEVQKNIENLGVYVDNILIKKRLDWVFDNQEIDISHWPKRPEGNFSEVKIIAEFDDLVVLYKPKNLVVQEGSGNLKNNLLYWLNNNGQIHLNFSSNTNLLLINRLDKDTSGLILIAKGQKSQEFYQNQFRQRGVEKKYLALVDNYVDKLWIVEHWQSRDFKNPLKQKLFWRQSDALQYSKLSRYCKTLIRPVYYNKELNQTIVEVEIFTGRMHQIRVVCEALGFPLFKDKVYSDAQKQIPREIQPFSINPNWKELSKQDFYELTESIFGEYDFSLLSNFISIKDQAGKNLEFEIVHIDLLN